MRAILPEKAGLEMVRRALLLAEPLRPGNALRASLATDVETAALVTALKAMHHERLLNVVSVEGPLGDDYILGGLTHRGRVLLHSVRDEHAWVQLKAEVTRPGEPLTLARIIAAAGLD